MSDLPDIVVWVFVAIIGLSLGSFLTCALYRLPRGLSIWKNDAHHRSICPACQHPLGWRDLFPVLSWLIQRGRCRYCNTPISWRYPAVEMATMVVVLTFFKFAGF